MNTEDSNVEVINIDSSAWTGQDPDGGRWKRLGNMAGGSDLGCTLEEIQPGGRPARYHYHLANEEALFVLAGEGTLRLPGREQAIRAGDYVAFPAGETGAHAVENTSNRPLRCLFFSTIREPDVTIYPDDEELVVEGMETTFLLTQDSDE